MTDDDLDNGSRMTIDSMIDQVRIQNRSRDTLPEMPEDADPDERSRAYANLVMSSNARIEQMFRIVELMRKEEVEHDTYVEQRMTRIEDGVNQERPRAACTGMTSPRTSWIM